MDCDRPLRARGLCAGHYRRLMSGSDLDAPMITPQRYAGKPCDVVDCDTPAHAKGLCTFHYSRLWRGTTPVDAPRREPGTWGDWYVIKSSGYVERMRRTSKGPGRSPKERQLQHRVVWEEAHGPLLPGQNIHHKNGVRHDNRLENLELWDTSQPAGQRAEDKLAYAREMFERYAEPGEVWRQK